MRIATLRPLSPANVIPAARRMWRSKPRTTGLLTRVGDNDVDVLTYKSLQDSTALATYISTLGAYAITIICVIEHVWSLCIICVSNTII